MQNIGTLVSGTIIAQLIPIFLQPFLRRFYSPEIFGAYAVYTSLVGIIIIVSSFKYELAIVLPRKDKEAANILVVSQIINICFNLLVLAFIILFHTSFLHYLNISSQYGIFLYFVPLGAIFYNLYTSINYWLIRQKSFAPIALNKIIRRSFEGAAQIGCYFGKISVGLLVGDILGHLSNIISGIYQSYKNKLDFQKISIVKMKYVLNKYFEYPKYNLLPSFMSACSFLLPTIFINKFFTTENTGYFDLSKLLLSIPLALIASSISNVLLQRISEKFIKTLSIRKDLLLILGIVLVITVVEISTITAWGEQIFVLIFGGKWKMSGSISKIMVWAYAYNFIIASFSSVFIAIKKIKLLSIWQVIYFCSILMLNFFKHLDFIRFINVYVVIEIITCSLYSFFLLKIVLEYERGIISTKP
jgi:O-antigen/teichoic acid export membrane protein